MSNIIEKTSKLFINPKHDDPSASSSSSSSSSSNQTSAGELKNFKLEDEYVIEKTIGQGHYAVVKSAKHLFSGERVAIKVIDKMKLDKISREHLFQEVKCMKLIKHPNVVKLYEVIDTTSKLYLVLEYGDGGDLYDLIMKHSNGISEQKAKYYFKQIVKAIKYCHDLHVVHRDLKPENVVFFEQTGQVKLTDFGFSNVFEPGTKLSTSCGSLAYSAPEILLGDAYDAPAVDVWSLGVILFMLVTGKPPFNEANDSETLTKILDCKYNIPKFLTNDCIELISSMLIRDPSKRICLSDLINHKWLNNNINNINNSNGDLYDNINELIPLKLRQLNHHHANDNQRLGANSLFVKTSTKFQTPCLISSSLKNSLINEENYLKIAPLIKKPELALTEKDKQEIIACMVNGNIADEEKIVKAIEEDNYNYITATYYLLAESILKKQFQKNLKKNLEIIQEQLNASPTATTTSSPTEHDPTKKQETTITPPTPTQNSSLTELSTTSSTSSTIIQQQQHSHHHQINSDVLTSCVSSTSPKLTLKHKLRTLTQQTVNKSNLNPKTS